MQLPSMAGKQCYLPLASEPPHLGRLNIDVDKKNNNIYLIHLQEEHGHTSSPHAAFKIGNAMIGIEVRANQTS